MTIFKGILDNWKHDFRNNPLIFWFELIGTLGCIVAAGSLALLAPHPNLIVTYSAYMIGSSSLMVSSWLRKNGFWFFLNMFFFVVDVIGLTNTLRG
jgi:hypothetical protein